MKKIQKMTAIEIGEALQEMETLTTEQYQELLDNDCVV